MLSTETKGWAGTWAPKFKSAMANSKKATDEQHWARDSKNKPSGPAQPVENTTFY